MKTRTAHYLVFILTVAIATSAFGTYNDGNFLIKGWRELRKAMDSPTAEIDYFNVGIFIGYVEGITEVYNGALFSYPYGTIRQQIVQIVGNYLEKHPERWNVAGFELIIDAMKEAYPLKR